MKLKGSSSYQQAKGLGFLGLFGNILLIAMTGLLINHQLEIDEVIDRVAEKVGNEEIVAHFAAEWIYDDMGVRNENYYGYDQEKIEFVKAVSAKLKNIRWGENVESIGNGVKLFWSLFAKVFLGLHVIYLVNDFLLVIGLLTKIKFLLFPWIIVSCIYYILLTCSVCFHMYQSYNVSQLMYSAPGWLYSSLILFVSGWFAFSFYHIWIKFLSVQLILGAYRHISKNKKKESGHLVNNIMDGTSDKIFLINPNE
jgi:hypothetical protein